MMRWLSVPRRGTPGFFRYPGFLSLPWGGGLETQGYTAGLRLPYFNAVAGVLLELMEADLSASTIEHHLDGLSTKHFALMSPAGRGPRILAAALRRMRHDLTYHDTAYGAEFLAVIPLQVSFSGMQWCR